VIGIVFFAVLLWMLYSIQPAISVQAPPLDPAADPLRLLGAALVAPDAYVLPFELASVLLLAALIGSIFIAWERK
jgi:NADH-quinone oxidoreductase subunit J